MTTPTAAPAAAPSAAPAAPSTPAPAAPAGGAPAAQPTGGQPSAAPAAPPKPNLLRRKETINGKETELEVSEDELWASFRKSKAADQRFEESAKLRKEAAQKEQALQQLQQQFTKDPRAVLRWLKENGVENPMDLVANALQGELAEEEQLQDPLVRRAVEAERQLQTIEQQRQQQELSQRTEAFEAEVNQSIDEISEVFDGALKLVNLPADDDTLQIMAQLESENRRRGLKIGPEKLAQLTQDRVVARTLNVFAKLPDADLLKLNPEFTKRFTKAITDDWKARKAKAAAAPQAPASTTAPPVAPAQPKVMSDKEEWEKIAPGRRVLRSI